MEKNTCQSIALIDPVGRKAGIDHYDLLLLKGIAEQGHPVYLYSNFDHQYKQIITKYLFHNTGVAKYKAILSNISGFIRSLLDARRKKVDWIIVHIFRAGVFDLTLFSLARLMGFKICAIVHDIESLDTYSLPFVRRMVISSLPHVRVVHNEFCREELVKKISGSVRNNTEVIPHVNFCSLFSDLHENKERYQELRSNSKAINSMHPALFEKINSGVPMVLFFGQIKKAKGLDVLLEAMAQTVTPFTLVVAGKMRNERWDKYANIINSLNLHERVVPVIRHISDEERNILFASCKVLVLPYLLIYQSGVLLMGMSFPVNVIASDLPPNREILKERRNGLFFEAGNSTALARQIDLFFSGKIDTDVMRQQALEDVQSDFNPSRIGKMYSKMLQAY